MASSSLLGGSQIPPESSGKDMHALGPSDNSDTGSDAIGAYGDDELASDSDSAGTGERASVGTLGNQPDADILPDHMEELASVAPVDALDELEGDPSGDLREVEDLADDSEDLEASEGEAGDPGDHGDTRANPTRGA